MTAEPIEDMPTFGLILHPLVLTAMYEGAVLQLAVATGRLSARKYRRITGMTEAEAAAHLEALAHEAEQTIDRAERMSVPLGALWGSALQAVSDGRVEIVDPAADSHGRAN